MDYIIYIILTFVRIVVGVIFLGLIAVAVGYFLLTRSIPNYSSTHEVHGITGPVEIIRDRYAIPHIFGGTDEDVFFGLGFAHAQDRLWQMTMLRRAAYGRLSEIFGSETLEIDRLIRIYDMRALAEAAYDEQDTITQAALQAYSQGVNAWLNYIDNSLFNNGAPEFLLFDDNIRPWQPSDSIAILNLQAIDLSGHAEREILRLKVASTGIGNKINDIMPDDPIRGVVLPLLNHNEFSELQRSLFSHYGMNIFSTNGLGASNVFAASPEMTATGASLLANDPHLRFTTPSIWMLARLELSSGGVIGATIPGIPVISLGRSSNLAWGVTSSYVDDQDLFLEQLASDNEFEYQTPQGSTRFRNRIDVIDVKGEPSREVLLKWTENGPVIPAEYFGLEDTLSRDQFLTLGWTLLNKPNTSITAAVRLMKARSVDEALAAAELYRSPQLNLLVADRSEIAMQVIGAVPQRSQFHENQGTLPSPGWKMRNRWLGEVPYDRLPRFRSSEYGFLANTNNKIIDQPFPDHLSSYWGDVLRFERLKELLRERNNHTINSFKNIQLDTVSYAARILIPEMARNLWHTSHTPSSDEIVQIRNKALQLLSNWDGEMHENSPEPLIYVAWIQSLQRLLIQDDIGNLASDFSRPNPVFLERVLRNIDGAATWCDINQTVTVENCDDISLIALNEGLSILREQFGSDVETWRWGQAHQAHQKHPVLGEQPFLSWIFNIRQPIAGGDQTINNAKTNTLGENPFESVHGAGYRGIYDFSDLNASQFVISTGQSGHPLSQHFDDQTSLWKVGEYTTMSLDPADARSNTIGITKLEPATSQ